MKIPFLPSPRDEYDKLGKEIASLEKYLAPVNEARLERQFALDKARANYMSSPSSDNLNAWETARTRAVGMKNADTFGSTFSHLETIRGDVESIVSTQREALKTSSKAKAIYRRCLVEIIEGIRCSIAAKRSEISSKLSEIEATFNVDEIQPLPLWNGRVVALERLLGDMDIQSAHPAVLIRQGWLDQIREAIELGQRHLTDAPPTPVKPRQQQAWPPGTSFAQAGVEPDAPPAAPEPVNAVPKEVDQAIRQQLVEQQNKHFEREQAQFEERLAAERAAAATKQQQAEALVGV